MTVNINPFVVYGHIPAEYFCDREQESAELLRFLRGQQNVVLSARRRMGKTKLVEYVLEQPEIAHDYIVVNIDILGTSNLSEFVFMLGNAVFTQVAKRSERLLKLFPTILKSLHASFGYDPVQNTPTFDIKLGDLVQPAYTLKEIFSYLDHADKRCLVVIDEFQQITNYPEQNVEATLRTYMQQTRNANFIFSGSQRRILSEMFGSEKRPFYHSARSIALEPIDRDVYTRFALANFRKAGKEILPEAVAFIYQAFQGVTLYNQQILNDAFSLTPEGETCDLNMAKRLVDSYIQENDKRMRELCQFVSEQQKAVLFAIAEDEPADHITSAAFTKRHRLKSPSATQSAVKALLRSDLITRQNGLYSVSDSLMDLWLKQKMLPQH